MIKKLQQKYNPRVFSMFPYIETRSLLAYYEEKPRNLHKYHLEQHPHRAKVVRAKQIKPDFEHLFLTIGHRTEPYPNKNLESNQLIAFLRPNS
jgi:hypothetical protein